MLFTCYLQIWLVKKKTLYKRTVDCSSSNSNIGLFTSLSDFNGCQGILWCLTSVSGTFHLKDSKKSHVSLPWWNQGNSKWDLEKLVCFSSFIILSIKFICSSKLGSSTRLIPSKRIWPISYKVLSLSQSCKFIACITWQAWNVAAEWFWLFWWGLSDLVSAKYQVTKLYSSIPQVELTHVEVMGASVFGAQCAASNTPVEIKQWRCVAFA